MRINNLQINGFGNLENKKIEFDDKINLIVGKNESGKSTITNFIKSMLYGVNRNKDGYRFSDFEKYKPWKDIEFSGKMEYTQDDEKYTAVRDFNRNNCKIYDKDSNDITNEFNKDKMRGAEIGIATLGLDEDTFQNSALIKQCEVGVEESSQKSIVQKLSNMIQSGDEGVSYEKVKSKLEKILLDEVGSDRSHTKPKNILSKQILENERAKEQLIANRERHNKISSEIEKIAEQKRSVDIEIENVSKVYEIKDKYEKMYKEKKEVFDETTKVLEKERAESEKQKKGKTKNMIMLLSILVLILVVTLVVVKQYVLSGISAILGVIFVCVYHKINSKNKNTRTEERDFSMIGEDIKKKEEKELENVKNKTGLTTRKAADLYNLLDGLKNKQKDYELQEHKLKIEDDMTKSHVMKLNEIEEQLEADYEKMQKITKNENSLKLAIEVLEKSYNELKSDVIPQIAENIREAIAETTNGEYVNVKYNDSEGMLVENCVGELIRIEKLSIGTIDQMYFGFRKAILKNMKDVPIIADETFAYYDDKRLENILKIIEKMSEKNQVIMMSCSKREQQTLDKLKIKYNLIEM